MNDSLQAMVFIKTTNSSVYACDLAEELEIRDIPVKLCDDGVMVNKEDYSCALSILQELEGELI